MATGKSRKTDALDRRLHFLGRRLNTAQKAWGLIKDGDRILLGLSGGKDSLALMHLLVHWRRAAPVAFDLAALHVQVADQPGNQQRQATLTDHAATVNVPVAYATAPPPLSSPACAALLADDLHEDAPLPRIVIMIDNDNLLPGAQYQFAFVDRYRDTRSHEGGAQMGEAVVVTPGVTVAGGHFFRPQLFQGFGHVRYQRRLELDGGDRGRRADGEDIGNALADASLAHRLAHGRGEIVDIAEAAGRQGDGPAGYHCLDLSLM